MGPNSKIFLLKSYKNDRREMGWEPICDKKKKKQQTNPGTVKFMLIFFLPL